MKNKKIEILKETDDFLVINKPAGLIVHPDGKTDEPSVSSWILETYPEMKEVGEPTTLQDGTILYRPGIVHRLDRDTSGALVVAKNQETFDFLKKQFQDRQVLKKYIAFVYGVIRDDRGIINKPIARSKGDFRRWSAERGSRGEAREAITIYRVLSRGDGDYGQNGEHPKSATLVEFEPKTGRTHQIRVHCKAIGHPIVGDSLYSEPYIIKNPDFLGFKRQALHARSITFTLPNIEESIKVEAPFPLDFKKALADFGFTC